MIISFKTSFAIAALAAGLATSAAMAQAPATEPERGMHEPTTPPHEKSERAMPDQKKDAAPSPPGAERGMEKK